VKSVMDTHMHYGVGEETEVAIDSRIGGRKFQRAKERRHSEKVFAGSRGAKTECALRTFKDCKQRTRRSPTGSRQRERFGGDVCRVAQKVSGDCVLGPAE
jgi:hypothetical protein